MNVVLYDTWSDGSDADPIAWKGGELVEYVRVLDPETGQTRDITLAQHIDGERMPVGESARLVCEIVVDDRVAHRADGGTYVAKKDKWRCVGMAAA